jgi:hypothetical protein
MRRKLACVACVICSALCAGALDRDAFTFTKYDLNVRIEPEQQRLGVRGKISLRNDSAAPQRSLSLQISSSLNWSSIQFQGKPVEFVSQIYTSDIDHSGALSEAIVVLPQAVASKQTIELDIGYEGVIPQDATRLTRIGVPEDQAKHAEWDEISRGFTAVRGIGYVAWYPVAMAAVSMSDGDSEEQAVARWKMREADCTMSLLFKSTSPVPILFSGNPELAEVNIEDGIKKIRAYEMLRFGVNVPTFVIASYSEIENKDTFLAVRYLQGQEQAAKEYANAAEQLDSVVMVARRPLNLQILGLPDADDDSFVSEGMLLTPLKLPSENDVVLNIVYARALNSVISRRPWIKEGLAHYAQAAVVESLQSRQAALDYLQSREKGLVESEAKFKSASGERTLVDSPDDTYLQTKSMYVWWMLHDMVGSSAVPGALISYQVSDDNDPTYMQKLIEKGAHRELQWFFDDWVYHDRGVPDFRITSVYPSQLPRGGYLVTVTVENSGTAAAEVPVILHGKRETKERLVVLAKSKASLRIETADIPESATVNDGSVPESDTTNNDFKVNH